MSQPNSWRHLRTSVLTGDAASVSFTGLDTTYRRFLVVAYIVKDANAGEIYLRFNGDAGATYQQQHLRVNSTTLTPARNTLNQIQPQVDAMDATVGRVITMDGRVSTAAITMTLTADEWTNTADLINRIDVLASSNNLAAGTRVTIFGSP